jgi:DNA-binding HxlR family transcriptional regulator
MRPKSFAGMNCSVAQTLEVVGERWSLLIIRDAFLGVTRFDDFQARLEISRNTLADRLGELVERGVLERRPYQDHPARYDYVLTEKGRDLWPVITAMRQWGDKWEAPQGPPVISVHRHCGHPLGAAMVCEHCGERVDSTSVRVLPGPGARPDRPPVPVPVHAEADV